MFLIEVLIKDTTRKTSIKNGIILFKGHSTRARFHEWVFEKNYGIPLESGAFCVPCCCDDATVAASAVISVSVSVLGCEGAEDGVIAALPLGKRPSVGET